MISHCDPGVDLRPDVHPNEVRDIVHFVESLRVEAHLQELRTTDLEQADVAYARRRVWATSSPAADSGHIGERGIAGDYSTARASLSSSQIVKTAVAH